MADVEVKFVNHSFAKILCEQSITNELSFRYTFYSPNYKFDKRYRAGIWDGRIRLFNKSSGLMPVGLIPDLLRFSKECGYTFRVDRDLVPTSSLGDLSLPAVDDLCQALEPHDKDARLEYYPYQLQYIEHALRRNRAVLLSPTSSGKSLMIYSLVRILADQQAVRGKILVIVPDVGLIHQMFGDFANYSNKQRDRWDVLDKVHCIYAGQQKSTDKQIVISTYQSLNTIEDPSYYEQYDAVFVDECHLAKAAVIKGIMEKCVNARYRFGLTGTLDGENVNELTITGLFGPPVQFVHTHELIEMGAATKLTIKPKILVYPDHVKEAASGCDYKNEIRYLVENEARNVYIQDLLKGLKGNTLVLTNYVKHGEMISERLQALVDWEVLNIDGRMDGEERKALQDHIGTLTQSTTVATYKTFSTGVNVKNFNHVVFAHPSKGRIRVLQSIGRGLRKFKGKTEITLHDVVDDLRHEGIINYAITHFAKRLAIYKEQKFPVEIEVIKL